jgi:hypothetical protein
MQPTSPGAVAVYTHSSRTLFLLFVLFIYVRCRPSPPPPMADGPPTVRFSNGRRPSVKKLKRRSGDSAYTPRTLVHADKDKQQNMAASFLQFW